MDTHHDSSDDDLEAKNKLWSERLTGKHFVEGTVTTKQTDQFCAADLPKPYRVLKPDSIMTRDYRTDRLNVLLNNDNVVTRAYYG